MSKNTCVNDKAGGNKLVLDPCFSVMKLIRVVREAFLMGDTCVWILKEKSSDLWSSIWSDTKHECIFFFGEYLIATLLIKTINE